MTDEELLKKFKAGDDEAFKEIFRRYESEMIAHAWKTTSDAELSKDVCQETFLKLIKKPPMILFGGKLRPWLYRVCRNLAVDKMRRLKPHEDLNEHFGLRDDKSLSPDKEILQLGDWQLIRRVLLDLPDDLQELVEDRIYQGLSFKEIAIKQKIPLGTALWRMKRALELLKEGYLKYE